MVEALLLLLSLVLVAICGVFVAAEFSLLAVNRSTVERLSEHGDQQATGVLAALKSLTTHLWGAQIGITVTSLTIGFLAQPALARLLHGPLLQLGISDTAADGLAIAVAVAIATMVTMIFGELVPKNIALAGPLATAKVVQRLLRPFTKLMRGPIAGLRVTATFLLRRLGIEAQEELASARSADELLSLVRRSAEKGTLPKETAAMMERSLTFGDLTAGDVMTSRTRMRTVRSNDSAQAVVVATRDSGLSRFPVTGEDSDDIVGIVHIKQALAIARDERHAKLVRDIMRPPVFVPSGVALDPLLAQLRQGGLQMAVVIDEFGGTDGIVTIEDLLEELVGEVDDEHDRRRAAIRKRGPQNWMLSGLLRPDEIAEEIDVFLPENEEYETIGGLMATELEHIPKTGEMVVVACIDRDGVAGQAELVVERMDGHRVDRIRLQVTKVEESA